MEANAHGWLGVQLGQTVFMYLLFFLPFFQLKPFELISKLRSRS
jgi:hypothetical protein